MTKFPKYKSQDDIPEGFADLYKEKDGEWVYEAPSPDTSAEDKLREALDNERAAHKATKKEMGQINERLKDLEQKQLGGEAGVTDDQLKELRAKIRADLESDILAMSADQLAGRFPQFKSLVDERDSARGETRTLRLDNQVQALMGKNGVRADRIEQLFRLESEQFDLTEDGKPKLTKHPGKTVDVFISDDLKKKYPEWFAGTQASGGGAGGSHEPGHIGVGKATADDIMKNPTQALSSARAQTGA